jgi:hypothetical protein
MTVRRMDHSIMRIVAAGSLAALMAACSSAAGAPTTTTPAVSIAPSIAPTPAPTTAATASAAPSPDTTVGDGEAWTAFQSTNGSGSIDLIRPDGTGRHMLFPLVPGGEQQHPDWSPDGRRLVFSVQGTDTEVLWVGDVDGTNTKQITQCLAPCAWTDEPAWSPDGRSIAYHRMVSKDGTGVSRLEIFDLATGKTRIAFTAPTQRAIYAPRWNKDGTQLVFEYVANASPAFDADVTGNALAIVDLTAAQPTPHEITKVEDRCNNPDWSWVSDMIICSKPVSTTGYDGPADIVSMTPDGTGLTAMTSVAADGKQAVMPTWLPDGSGIIFADWGGAMSTILADGTGLAPAIGGDPVTGFHPRVRPTP